MGKRGRGAGDRGAASRGAGGRGAGGRCESPAPEAADVITADVHDVLPPRGGRRAGRGAAARGRGCVIAARGRGRGAVGHDEPAIHGGTSSSSSSPAREEEVQAEAELEVEDEAGAAASQSKSKKRKAKISYQVKANDETKLLEWIEGEEFLWNHLKSNYKNTQMKAARWEEKGQELGYTGTHLKGWWSQMRDMWTKLHQTKSGQAAKPLSDRAIYIQQNMHFLSRVVRHHAKSVRPILPDPNTVPDGLEAAELDAMSDGRQQVEVADADAPQAASQHPRSKKQRTASSTDDVSELQQALHNSQDVLNKLVASQSAVPVSKSRREPFALYCYKAILNLPKDCYHNIKSQIFNILSNATGDSDDEDSDVVATQPACEPQQPPPQEWTRNPPPRSLHGSMDRDYMGRYWGAPSVQQRQYQVPTPGFQSLHQAPPPPQQHSTTEWPSGPSTLTSSPGRCFTSLQSVAPLTLTSTSSASASAALARANRTLDSHIPSISGLSGIELDNSANLNLSSLVRSIITPTTDEPQDRSLHTPTPTPSQD